MTTPPLGIQVTGHAISANGDALWRCQLDKLLKEAIRGVLPESKKHLPIRTSFPHDPYICSDPRPPISLTVAMTRSEIGLHELEDLQTFLEAVRGAMTAWIRESHWGPDDRPTPDLVIEVGWRCGVDSYVYHTTSTA